MKMRLAVAAIGCLISAALAETAAHAGQPSVSISAPFIAIIVSPDGTTITPGSGAGLAADVGVIITREGTWRFGAPPDAAGDYPLLLNGVNAGWAIRLQVTNGNLYLLSKAALYSVRWNAAWLAAGTAAPVENTVAAKITLSPARTLSVDMPVGTIVSTATVTMSPPSAKFTGPLVSSDPSYNANGLNVVTARPLTSADIGLHNTTITAVQ